MEPYLEFKLGRNKQKRQKNQIHTSIAPKSQYFSSKTKLQLAGKKTTGEKYNLAAQSIKSYRQQKLYQKVQNASHCLKRRLSRPKENLQLERKQGSEVRERTKPDG